MTVQCESNNASSALYRALEQADSHQALLSALFDFNIPDILATIRNYYIIQTFDLFCSNIIVHIGNII